MNQIDGVAMTGGTKHDTGKPRMELLPPLAMAEIAHVMSKGAEKYGDHNYLGGMKHGRLIGAALRHIFAHLSGHNNDELGTLHLANAAIDLMMVIEYMKRGIGEDDRFGAVDGLVPETETKYPIGFNAINQDGTLRKDLADKLIVDSLRGGLVRPLPETEEYFGIVGDIVRLSSGGGAAGRAVPPKGNTNISE